MVYGSPEEKHPTFIENTSGRDTTRSCRTELECLSSLILSELSLFDLSCFFWKTPLARMSIFDLTQSTSSTKYLPSKVFSQTMIIKKKTKTKTGNWLVLLPSLWVTIRRNNRLTNELKNKSFWREWCVYSGSETSNIFLGN